MRGTSKATRAKFASASAPPAASATSAAERMAKLNLQVELARPDEYQRAKRLFNQGRHPAFIGRDTLARAASQGGLLFLRDDAGGRDIAVALIGMRNGTLLAFNVHPDYRAFGVGSWFLRYLTPNFARVVEFAVPWFERNGYVRLGALKKGRSLNTQIMVRRGLLTVAGKLSRTHGRRCPCAECRAPESLASESAREAGGDCVASSDNPQESPSSTGNP